MSLTGLNIWCILCVFLNTETSMTNVLVHVCVIWYVLKLAHTFEKYFCYFIANGLNQVKPMGFKI